MSRIFGWLGPATTWLVLACGSTRPVPATNGAPPVTGVPTRSYPVTQVRLLAIEAAPPPDTILRVHRGEARTVVLRHPPPDNITFAQLVFPAEAFAAVGYDSIDVQIHIRPGVYGLDLTTSSPLALARLTFKYAVHFHAPAAAAARGPHGADVALERTLAIGKLVSDTAIVFQRSTRPAADNLETTLTSAGSYVVGAPP